MKNFFAFHFEAVTRRSGEGGGGGNEDSTRCRVYKSCNIEEKCHERWLHFPRIKYPWHGVKPTTNHRDNSYNSPRAHSRYRSPWKKSNDAEFPFSKFPPHSMVQRRFHRPAKKLDSLLRIETPISRLHKRSFFSRCTATNGSNREKSL